MTDDIARSLGRVEGKLDSLINKVSEQDERDNLRGVEIERRLSKVESRQHWYSGVAATLGALFGLYIGKP